MNTRPYVVCHVFAGLNGRIDGAYMLDPAASPARAAYSRMQVEFGADAVAYGAVTTKGFVGSRPLALGTHGSAPKGDFVAPHAERSFYISVDPVGEIAWESATYRRAGRADAHVIEVLTEAASPAYRDYLRERGVSYVLAGSRGLDLPLALRKLRELFGIERLLVCGGGKTDMSFLAAGVLDELSLVLSPTVSGEPETASVFDEMPRSAGGSHAFSLERVERLAGDGLHLVYRVRRRCRAVRFWRLPRGWPLRAALPAARRTGPPGSRAAPLRARSRRTRPSTTSSTTLCSMATGSCSSPQRSIRRRRI